MLHTITRGRRSPDKGERIFPGVEVGSIVMPLDYGRTARQKRSDAPHLEAFTRFLVMRVIHARTEQTYLGGGRRHGCPINTGRACKSVPRQRVVVHHPDIAVTGALVRGDG